MEFVKLTTPVGRVWINKDSVLAVTEENIAPAQCRIWIGTDNDACFNILESFDEVSKLLD